MDAFDRLLVSFLCSVFLVKFTRHVEKINMKTDWL